MEDANGSKLLTKVLRDITSNLVALMVCRQSGGRATPPASVVSSVHLDPDALDRLRHSVEAGVMAGFQIASGGGPLCEEPLWGVVFEVSQLLKPSLS